MTGSGRRWLAPGLATCRWANWEDDEYFLFNPASGKTHLLNALGRELLLLLAEKPHTSAELCKIFHDPETGLSEPQLSDLIDDQLRQLALVGLVEAWR